MNLFVRPGNTLYRSIKFRCHDKRRILRLQTLIEKSSADAAKKYMLYLFRKTKTSRYLMAYQLTVGNSRMPEKYRPILKDFIIKSGSSCGHGKYNSEYSPIFWLGFLYEDKLECRFIVNRFCFLSDSITLELEIEQEGRFHTITVTDCTQLQDPNPNSFRYSLPINLNKADEKNQVSFSLLIGKPCKIKIYHCPKNNARRNLVLQESITML
jgi:hypothetical protein